MRRLTVLALGLLAGLAILLGACGRREAARPVTPSLRIAADTSVATLAEGLLNAYEEQHPAVLLSMAPTGRNTALRALQSGEVDAALLLYPPSERSFFHTPIAREMLAIVAQPEVTINGLSRDDVRAIFSGQKVTWEELGSAPLPIEVITREWDSSTRLAFDALVMEGQPLTSSARLGFSDEHVLDLVAGVPGAIGYVPHSVLDGRVKVLAYEGALPTSQAADTFAYPLVTTVEFVTQDEPQGATRVLLDWMLSDEGQEVVRRYMLGLND